MSTPKGPAETTNTTDGQPGDGPSQVQPDTTASPPGTTDGVAGLTQLAEAVPTDPEELRKRLVVGAVLVSRTDTVRVVHIVSGDNIRFQEYRASEGVSLSKISLSEIAHAAESGHFVELKAPSQQIDITELLDLREGDQIVLHGGAIFTVQKRAEEYVRLDKPLFSEKAGDHRVRIAELHILCGLLIKEIRHAGS